MDLRSKERRMGKLKGYTQDWLDEYGYDMGFCWDNVPSTLEALNEIRRKKQDAKDYHDSKKENK